MKPRLMPKLVPLKSIGAPAAEFDAEQLRSAAQLVLDAGGLVYPLVVKRAVPGYALVSGNFWYWAAMLARNADPETLEYVAAVVIDSENGGAILGQVEIAS